VLGGIPYALPQQLTSLTVVAIEPDGRQQDNAVVPENPNAACLSPPDPAAFRCHVNFNYQGFAIK
jgi:hypothetical protein